ncbi:MAG: hypothetical protein ACRDD1_09195, partial [Planctomycetia bacterium]
EAGVATDNIIRCGVPDYFVLHAERKEQLAEVGLDADSLVEVALRAIEKFDVAGSTPALADGKRVG